MTSFDLTREKENENERELKIKEWEIEESKRFDSNNNNCIHPNRKRVQKKESKEGRKEEQEEESKGNRCHTNKQKTVEPNKDWKDNKPSHAHKILYLLWMKYYWREAGRGTNVTQHTRSKGGREREIEAQVDNERKEVTWVQSVLQDWDFVAR